MKKTLHQLPSGAKLILVPNKSTQAVSVMVIFGVGSRHEHKKINGISHFIEHLMFKGTTKRPTTLDISKALDRVGAEFNAGTAKDWTAYYIKVDNQHVELAMDVISDMIMNSKFDQTEIDRERGVIIEEINMYEDNPMMYIEDLLEQVVFDGNTLGWQISGPRSVIRNVSRQDILDYKNLFYQPNNAVICVAGNFPDDILAKVREYFTFPKSTDKIPDFQPFEFNQSEPRLKIKNQKTEQAQLAFGFPGYGYKDNRVHALYLLAVILGGNMSSRLFINIRERQGLCYFIRSYINIYQDTGCLVIQSGLDTKRIEQSIELILEELKKVSEEGVSQTELSEAKDFIKGKVILHLENSSDLAEWYAKQEILTDESLSPEDKFKLFDQVTVEDIQKAAKEIFRTECINLALIGPFDGGDQFKKLLDL
ncbi:MAG: M16 family metallopeptidase [Patescibacteria group bacterium]